MPAFVGHIARHVMIAQGFLVGCLIWFGAGSARALDPAKSISQYVHDAWSIEDGLPQSVVLSIHQTSDGYLWIGTQEGLARFDGVSFTVFDTQNTDALDSDFITCLMEDAAGRLWVGTYGGGVVVFDGVRFRPLTADNPLVSDRVQALCRGQGEQVWIGTEAGLSLYDQGRLTAFTEKEGLSNQWINAVFEDTQGTLWVGTYGGGVSRFKNGVWEQLTRANGLPSDRVLCFFQEPSGSVWIGTEGGLMRWRTGDSRTWTTQDGLNHNKVNGICQDDQGVLWLATDFGLNRMIGDGVIEGTRHGDLSHDEAKVLFVDREGSLWVGTAGGGLNRLRDAKITAFTTRNGLSQDEIWSVYADSRKRIFVGSEAGHLDVLQDGRFAPHPPIDGLEQADIMSIMESRDGALWLGTDGRGIFSIKDGRVRRFTTDSGLSHNRVLCLFEDASGAIWAGTYGGGLNRLEADQVRVWGTRDGLPSNRINAIHQSSDGSLWLCTNGGLARLKDGLITALTMQDGLSNNIVNCITEDRDGALWIGTHGGGICRYFQGSWQTTTTRQGLFADAVYKILEDDLGRFWCSCNKGIFFVTKSDLMGDAPVRCTAFSEPDGMVVRECNGGYQSCGHRSADGRLWFPTIKGLVMIDPEHIPSNTVPPPVRIESVSVDQDTTTIPGRNARRTIVLEPGTRRLEIAYTGLSFRVPERVRFKYRLQGFDEDWVFVDTRRTAFYTNIPPGDYVFQANACNDDGVWHPEGDAIAITLQPFFYQTTWFILSCIAVAALIGLAGYRLRVHQLKTRAHQLHRLVEERTRDLRRKNAELETVDRIVKIINREVDLKNVLDSLLKQIVVLFPQAQKACFWLHESNATFRIAAARGFAPGQLNAISLSEETIRNRYLTVGEELEEGISIIKAFDELAGQEAIQHLEPPKCLLSMSVELADQLVGFLVLENMDDADAFAHSDVRQLFRFREHAVSAITKAKNLSELAREKERTETALEETRQAHQKMEHMARTDPLTDLSNRRDMMDRIDHEKSRHERSGHPFCLILADIDDFKSFNDRFGHDCGDFVLVQVADTMRSMVRKQDAVGRWGGEEFMLLLPETDRLGGRVLAEKIRSRIARKRFTYNAHEFSIFLTFGVAVYRDQKTAVDAMIKVADQNLYLGKKQGKNCVVA